MRHVPTRIPLLAALSAALPILLAPAVSSASAFDAHSSWREEPMLETAKGVSLGVSVLEFGTGVRYLDSNRYFTSNGKLQEALYKFEIISWDFFLRFGFTDNWTFWFNLPLVWSDQTNAARPRKTEGEVGDSEAGVLYQFFHQNDPMISMGLSLRWKLPTGAESVGANNHNITGTGTTDVDLSYLGRWQLFKYMALGWNVGYNLRLPGAVQYISDRHTSITNASLDLGDEIYGQLDIIGAFDYVALSISGRYTYRLPTKMATPEYRFETVRYETPALGVQEETFMLYNGATYEEWDSLSPTGAQVSSAGWLFTLTPKLIVRPLSWLDITFFVRLHVAGKNTQYLVDKDYDNSTIDAFMPMQALGQKAGGMVLGEIGGATTFRW